MAEADGGVELCPEDIFRMVSHHTHDETRDWCLAFSGGVDSAVLLHLLHGAMPRHPKVRLRAVHVDHGLQADSRQWADHCRKACEALGVDFRLERLPPLDAKGRGWEAAAREGRYRALQRHVPPGGLLFTAHHRDDQVETLLLRLFRGAGSIGLSGIRPVQRRNDVILVRPLLSYRREAITRYARQHRLQWVVDPSNSRFHQDRNFVRHRVLPLVRERWPGVGKVLVRLAANAADSAVLEADLARLDYPACRGGAPNRLRVREFSRLSGVRRVNLLRHWLLWLGYPPLEKKQLLAACDMMVDARNDAEPVFRRPFLELRRYRGEIYLLSGGQPPPGERLWWPPDVLSYPSLRAVLRGEVKAGSGISTSRLAEGGRLRVRFREGGETIQLNGHRRKLKTLFQGGCLPPWERDRIPLIYQGDELVAVPGVAISDSVRSIGPEPALVPVWTLEESREMDGL